MTPDQIMKKCTTQKTVKGMTTISCKLGLWAVSGGDKDRVMNEARHYFGQYLRDGEYDGILEVVK